MYSGDNHERETRMTQRLVFLGNHTVGVRSLRSLIDVCDVELVVAHPPDPEDGVRYESVHDFAVSRSLSVVRSKGKDPDLISRIRSIEPDLIWTTDYRYLLPTDLIQSAKKACINLHPSLLPKYRGRHRSTGQFSMERARSVLPLTSSTMEWILVLLCVKGRSQSANRRMWGTYSDDSSRSTNQFRSMSSGISNRVTCRLYVSQMETGASGQGAHPKMVGSIGRSQRMTSSI